MQRQLGDPSTNSTGDRRCEVGDLGLLRSEETQTTRERSRSHNQSICVINFFTFYLSRTSLARDRNSPGLLHL